VWKPYDELMTGCPPDGRCHPPRPFAAFVDGNPTALRDCAAVADGYLLMFDFASVVVASDGAVLDAFPTAGLRPVGSIRGLILFVAGGGPTSWTGYFGPAPVVRDVANRRWVEGELRRGLPRYVAGTVGDVKWSIVCDLRERLGYRISPRWLGDQCGGTFTCVDNRYAHDSADFVVECATG
jgi:hypothetical protein